MEPNWTSRTDTENEVPPKIILRPRSASVGTDTATKGPLKGNNAVGQLISGPTRIKNMQSAGDSTAIITAQPQPYVYPWKKKRPRPPTPEPRPSTSAAMTKNRSPSPIARKLQAEVQLLPDSPVKKISLTHKHLPVVVNPPSDHNQQQQVSSNSSAELLQKISPTPSSQIVPKAAVVLSSKNVHHNVSSGPQQVLPTQTTLKITAAPPSNPSVPSNPFSRISPHKETFPSTYPEVLNHDRNAVGETSILSPVDTSRVRVSPAKNPNLFMSNDTDAINNEDGNEVQEKPQGSQSLQVMTPQPYAVVTNFPINDKQSSTTLPLAKEEASAEIPRRRIGPANNPALLRAEPDQPSDDGITASSDQNAGQKKMTETSPSADARQDITHNKLSSPLSVAKQTFNQSGNTHTMGNFKANEYPVSQESLKQPVQNQLPLAIGIRDSNSQDNLERPKRQRSQPRTQQSTGPLDLNNTSDLLAVPTHKTDAPVQQSKSVPPKKKSFATRLQNAFIRSQPSDSVIFPWESFESLSNESSSGNDDITQPETKQKVQQPEPSLSEPQSTSPTVPVLMSASQYEQKQIGNQQNIFHVDQQTKHDTETGHIPTNSQQSQYQHTRPVGTEAQSDDKSSVHTSPDTLSSAVAASALTSTRKHPERPPASLFKDKMELPGLKSTKPLSSPRVNRAVAKPATANLPSARKITSEIQSDKIQTQGYRYPSQRKPAAPSHRHSSGIENVAKNSLQNTEQKSQQDVRKSATILADTDAGHFQTFHGAESRNLVPSGVEKASKVPIPSSPVIMQETERQRNVTPLSKSSSLPRTERASIQQAATSSPLPQENSSRTQVNSAKPNTYVYSWKKSRAVPKTDPAAPPLNNRIRVNNQPYQLIPNSSSSSTVSPEGRQGSSKSMNRPTSPESVQLADPDLSPWQASNTHLQRPSPLAFQAIQSEQTYKKQQFETGSKVHLSQNVDSSKSLHHLSTDLKDSSSLKNKYQSSKRHSSQAQNQDIFLTKSSSLQHVASKPSSPEPTFTRAHSPEHKVEKSSTSMIQPHRKPTHITRSQSPEHKTVRTSTTFTQPQKDLTHIKRPQSPEPQVSRPLLPYQSQRFASPPPTVEISKPMNLSKVELQSAQSQTHVLQGQQFSKRFQGDKTIALQSHVQSDTEGPKTVAPTVKPYIYSWKKSRKPTPNTPSPKPLISGAKPVVLAKLPITSLPASQKDGVPIVSKSSSAVSEASGNVLQSKKHHPDASSNDKNLVLVASKSSTQSTHNSTAISSATVSPQITRYRSVSSSSHTTAGDDKPNTTAVSAQKSVSASVSRKHLASKRQSRSKTRKRAPTPPTIRDTPFHQLYTKINKITSRIFGPSSSGAERISGIRRPPLKTEKQVADLKTAAPLLTGIDKHADLSTDVSPPLPFRPELNIVDKKADLSTDVSKPELKIMDKHVDLSNEVSRPEFKRADLSTEVSRPKLKQADLSTEVSRPEFKRADLSTEVSRPKLKQADLSTEVSRPKLKQADLSTEVSRPKLKQADLSTEVSRPKLKQADLSTEVSRPKLKQADLSTEVSRPLPLGPAEPATDDHDVSLQLGKSKTRFEIGQQKDEIKSGQGYKFTLGFFGDLDPFSDVDLKTEINEIENKSLEERKNRQHITAARIADKTKPTVPRTRTPSLSKKVASRIEISPESSDTLKRTDHVPYVAKPVPVVTETHPVPVRKEDTPYLITTKEKTDEMSASVEKTDIVPTTVKTSFFDTPPTNYTTVKKDPSPLRIIPKKDETSLTKPEESSGTTEKPFMDINLQASLISTQDKEGQMLAMDSKKEHVTSDVETLSKKSIRAKDVTVKKDVSPLWIIPKKEKVSLRQREVSSEKKEKKKEFISMSIQEKIYQTTAQISSLITTKLGTLTIDFGERKDFVSKTPTLVPGFKESDLVSKTPAIIKRFEEPRQPADSNAIKTEVNANVVTSTFENIIDTVHETSTQNATNDKISTLANLKEKQEDIITQSNAKTNKIEDQIMLSTVSESDNVKPTKSVSKELASPEKKHTLKVDTVETYIDGSSHNIVLDVKSDGTTVQRYVPVKQEENTGINVVTPKSKGLRTADRARGTLSTQKTTRKGAEPPTSHSYLETSEQVKSPPVTSVKIRSSKSTIKATTQTKMLSTNTSDPSTTPTSRPSITEISRPSITETSRPSITETSRPSITPTKTVSPGPPAGQSHAENISAEQQRALEIQTQAISADTSKASITPYKAKTTGRQTPTKLQKALKAETKEAKQIVTEAKLAKLSKASVTPTKSEFPETQAALPLKKHLKDETQTLTVAKSAKTSRASPASQAAEKVTKALPAEAQRSIQSEKELSAKVVTTPAKSVSPGSHDVITQAKILSDERQESPQSEKELSAKVVTTPAKSVSPGSHDVITQAKILSDERQESPQSEKELSAKVVTTPAKSVSPGSHDVITQAKILSDERQESPQSEQELSAKVVTTPAKSVSPGSHDVITQAKILSDERQESPQSEKELSAKVVTTPAKSVSPGSHDVITQAKILSDERQESPKSETEAVSANTLGAAVIVAKPKSLISQSVKTHAKPLSDETLQVSRPQTLAKETSRSAVTPTKAIPQEQLAAITHEQILTAETPRVSKSIAEAAHATETGRSDSPTLQQRKIPAKAVSQDTAVTQAETISAKRAAEQFSADKVSSETSIANATLTKEVTLEAPQDLVSPTQSVSAETKKAAKRQEQPVSAKTKAVITSATDVQHAMVATVVSVKADETLMVKETPFQPVQTETTTKAETVIKEAKLPSTATQKTVKNQTASATVSKLIPAAPSTDKPLTSPKSQIPTAAHNLAKKRVDAKDYPKDPLKTGRAQSLSRPPESTTAHTDSRPESPKKPVRGTKAQTKSKRPKSNQDSESKLSTAKTDTKSKSAVAHGKKSPEPESETAELDLLASDTDNQTSSIHLIHGADSLRHPKRILIITPNADGTVTARTVLADNKRKKRKELVSIHNEKIADWWSWLAKQWPVLPVLSSSEKPAEQTSDKKDSSKTHSAKSSLDLVPVYRFFCETVLGIPPREKLTEAQQQAKAAAGDGLSHLPPEAAELAGKALTKSPSDSGFLRTIGSLSSAAIFRVLVGAWPNHFIDPSPATAPLSPSPALTHMSKAMLGELPINTHVEPSIRPVHPSVSDALHELPFPGVGPAQSLVADGFPDSSRGPSTTNLLRQSTSRYSITTPIFGRFGNMSALPAFYSSTALNDNGTVRHAMNTEFDPNVVIPTLPSNNAAGLASGAHSSGLGRGFEASNSSGNALSASGHHRMDLCTGLGVQAVERTSSRQRFTDYSALSVRRSFQIRRERKDSAEFTK